MAIHWQVTFKTLRGGKTLTASVYDNLYSGEPIALKGGAEPFVTNENNDDDPFKAIRTQTGSLKIVDDGYALDGVTPFNWRDLQPRSDHDRPVILTDEDDNILWQGFLQAQNFSGTLYEATQEREFPVQCALSILGSQYPTTSRIGIVNFAFLLNYISSMVSAASVSVINFSEFIIQGGSDAQAWLSKKFHWANLLSEDSEEGLSPQYDLFTCLEDMCNFWGFQARTEGSRLYLMCQDDPSVQTLLTLSPADLATLATGTVAGTVSDNPFIRQDLTGDIFASNDNDDMWMNGPSEVSVKADCNEQSSSAEFAPPTVQKAMEDAGNYSWVSGTDANTGYYATPLIKTFESNIMSGSASDLILGGFCRMQIYSSSEQENATKIDAFVVRSNLRPRNPILQIRTNRMMSFSNGTLKFSGSVWNGNGWQQWDSQENDDVIVVHIGIGETYETAKWFYFNYTEFRVSYGWKSQKTQMPLLIGVGDIKGIAMINFHDNEVYMPVGAPTEEGMHGYVFVDFFDIRIETGETGGAYIVGNFKIEFSREQTYIPETVFDGLRPRVVQKDRVSSMEYKSLNENSIKNQQSIDLVYASDNNMKFGFGLVMEPTFEYMQGARYGDLVLQHPEQHLADRIVNFWAAAKRLVTADLQTQMVEQTEPITPLSHLVLGETHFRTLAISHQWRDDVTTVKMIQSLILIDDEEEEVEEIEEEL